MIRDINVICMPFWREVFDFRMVNILKIFSVIEFMLTDPFFIAIAYSIKNQGCQNMHLSHFGYMWQPFFLPETFFTVAVIHLMLVIIRFMLGYPFFSNSEVDCSILIQTCCIMLNKLRKQNKITCHRPYPFLLSWRKDVHGWKL